MSDSPFEFAPPNRVKLWRDLALTMSQAALLTGVSERQIQHWMDRGYITPHLPGSRRVNGEGLDAIVLIRQARIAGIPLRRAVAMAKEQLAKEETQGVDGWVVPSERDTLVEHLTSLRSGIGSVERLLRGAHPDLSVAAADGV